MSKYYQFISKNIKKILILGILGLVFFTAKKIYAQKLTLSISPPLTELTIKPGKSVLIAYKLTNYNDPVVVKTYLRSFVPADNFGNVKIENNALGPIRFQLDNSELSLNQPFFLKTNDSQQLLLRIRVPEGAPEGDYYYTFFAETNPQPASAGSITGRAQALIGANLLITVTQTGSVDIKSGIALFDTLDGLSIKEKIKIYDSSQIIPVVLIVKNMGKNLIKPQGTIELIGRLGGKTSYQILPQNILSQSQRQLIATPSANINYKKPTSLILSGFFIGNYQLTTKINFGEGTPTLYAKTSFFAFPFKLLAGLITILIVVFFIIRYLSKKETD